MQWFVRGTTKPKYDPEWIEKNIREIRFSHRDIGRFQILKARVKNLYFASVVYLLVGIFQSKDAK